MASTRVGRKWLKKTRRTRLPRLDTIPRRAVAGFDRNDDGAETTIIVDLSEGRAPAAPE